MKILTDVWINLVDPDGISAGALTETPPPDIPKNLRRLIARRYHVPETDVGTPKFLPAWRNKPVQRRGIDLAMDHIRQHGGTVQPGILVEQVRDLDIAGDGSLCVADALRSRVHYAVRTDDGQLHDVVPTPDKQVLFVPVTGLNIEQRYTRETVDATPADAESLIRSGLVDMDGLMCMVRLATALKNRRADVVRLFLAHPELGPISKHSWTTCANLLGLARQYRWCWNSGVGPVQHDPCHQGQRCCTTCLKAQTGPGYRLSTYLYDQTTPQERRVKRA